MDLFEDLKDLARQEKVRVKSRKQKLKYGAVMDGMITNLDLALKLGSKENTVFAAIKDKMYNNESTIKLDLNWKRELAQLLGYSGKNPIDNVTRIVRKLDEMDLICKIEGFEYVVNPLVYYRGSIQNSFLKAVIDYYINREGNFDTWIHDIFNKEFGNDPAYLRVIEDKRNELLKA